MQPTTFLQLAAVVVLCHQINGYSLEQLLNPSTSDGDGKHASLYRLVDGNTLAAQLNGVNAAKKSLKKFQGNGSRNCFFSPITCMIQHDVSKYRKLVDNSYYGTGGVSKRLWWQRED